MASASATFYRIIQGMQEYASDSEYMISRIFFRVPIGGQTCEGRADLKQLVGSGFETPGSIEVSAPAEYAGPIGGAGRGIHISGAKNIRMYNNIFEFARTVLINTQEDSPPSW